MGITARIAATLAGSAMVLSAAVVPASAAPTGTARTSGGTSVSTSAAVSAAEGEAPARKKAGESCSTQTTVRTAALAAGAEDASRPGLAPTYDCPPAGSGWDFVEEYFWARDCINAGGRGTRNGRWQTYHCTCGSATSYYELWVR